MQIMAGLREFAIMLFIVVLLAIILLFSLIAGIVYCRLQNKKEKVKTAILKAMGESKSGPGKKIVISDIWLNLENVPWKRFESAVWELVAERKIILHSHSPNMEISNKDRAELINVVHKLWFAIVRCGSDPRSGNVAGVICDRRAGFSAGSLAGLMTKAKIVGIVTGIGSLQVAQFRNGFESGLKKTCPDCKILSARIDSFLDPDRGKAAALSHTDKGADVVFCGGGMTGSAAAFEAVRIGAWAIGVNHNEYPTILKQSYAIQTAEEGIRLVPFCSTGNPEALRTKLNEIDMELKSGKIKLA